MSADELPDVKECNESLQIGIGILNKIWMGASKL